MKRSWRTTYAPTKKALDVEDIESRNRPGGHISEQDGSGGVEDDREHHIDGDSDGRPGGEAVRMVQRVSHAATRNGSKWVSTDSATARRRAYLRRESPTRRAEP